MDALLWTGALLGTAVRDNQSRMLASNSSPSRAANLACQALQPPIQPPNPTPTTTIHPLNRPNDPYTYPPNLCLDRRPAPAGLC
eukprot:357218-Chlamydomonas_euryale.AAC.32